MKKLVSNPLLLALASGIVLPSFYWFFFWRLPAVDPAEAKRTIASAKPEEVVIIDLRCQSEYEKQHLALSVNLPNQNFYASRQEWPKLGRDKKHIFVICNSGKLSAPAAAQLREAGLSQAASIRGGFDAWIKNQPNDSMVNTPLGQTRAVPRVHFSWLDQFAIVFAAFFIKPTYMLLTILIAVLLWKKTETDFVSLRRAMIAFLCGEIACAVNFVLSNNDSEFWEYAHSYGMLVAFAFLTYAVMKTVDQRLVNFSDREVKCLLLPLCKRCYKYQDVSCTLRIDFLYVVMAAIVMAFMPLTGTLGSFFCIGTIFDDPNVIFGHTAAQQMFEARLCPLVAIVFFILSGSRLFIYKENGIARAKIYFAAGMGFLGFGLMRFLTSWSYERNQLWGDVWEEITEFILIVGILWIIYSASKLRRLGQDKPGEQASVRSV